MNRNFCLIAFVVFIVINDILGGIQEYKTLDLLVGNSLVGLDGLTVGMERDGGHHPKILLLHNCYR